MNTLIVVGLILMGVGFLLALANMVRIFCQDDFDFKTGVGSHAFFSGIAVIGTLLLIAGILKEVL